MKRTIRDFDADEENAWRAKLDCGHYQHVRHDPPLIVRDWVLSEVGQRAMIGVQLECKKCDESKPPDFDQFVARTGNVLYGSPPRPLDAITLETHNGEVFANGRRGSRK